MKTPAPTLAEIWFAQNGWEVFPFQHDVWRAVANGSSGLLHATTGAGKTYAVWLAALNKFASLGVAPESGARENRSRKTRPFPAPPLTVLWITPMRALAADTERALNAPVAALNLHWSIGMRIGDTHAAERAR